MVAGEAVRIERTEIELEAGDELTLRGVRVLGPGRPKASVILAHGYAEHGGRYDALIKTLAASRFAVYAVDHRGHGRSDGERAYVPGFDRYVEDFRLIVERARNEHPGKPCYLVGHSMGALIALTYALARQDDFAGIILLAPVIRFRPSARLRRKALLRRIGRAAPRFPLLAERRGIRSRDPAVDVAVEQDPFCYHGKVRAGMIVALAEAGEAALARAHELKLPVLIMHGDDDPLIDPAGSLDLYQRIGVRERVDNSLITWPSLRHELLNEPDGEHVVGVILAWLNGHYTEWRKAQPRAETAR